MLQGPDRRNFLVLAIQGLGAVIAGALGVPALTYLFAPPKAKNDAAWIEVADLAKLPAGEPAEIIFSHKRVDGWKVVTEKTSAWVVKTGETEAFALAPACTHLGCAYHWKHDSKEFTCPCHASSFSIDGKVQAGPAPRPLDRYESRVVNGKVQVGRVVASDSPGAAGGKA